MPLKPAALPSLPGLAGERLRSAGCRPCRGADGGAWGLVQEQLAEQAQAAQRREDEGPGRKAAPAASLFSKFRKNVKGL